MPMASMMDSVSGWVVVMVGLGWVVVDWFECISHWFLRGFYGLYDCG